MFRKHKCILTFKMAKKPVCLTCKNKGCVTYCRFPKPVTVTTALAVPTAPKQRAA